MHKVTDNVIQVTKEKMEELKKLRPKRTGITPKSLDSAVCILIKFLNSDRTRWEWEVTGKFDATRLGRAILAQVMLITAEDILSHDDPEAVYGLIEILEKLAYGETASEEDDEESEE